jgi:hypothetical protein
MSLTSGAPQPTLAWTFENSNVDSVSSIAPTTSSGPPTYNSAGKYGSSIGVYVNGSQLPNTNNSSGLSAPSGGFTIGKSFGTSNSTYYYGEIYEILVFTTSLYDLDGTSTITQIYQNQLSYTGT